VIFAYSERICKEKLIKGLKLSAIVVSLQTLVSFFIGFFGEKERSFRGITAILTSLIN